MVVAAKSGIVKGVWQRWIRRYEMRLINADELKEKIRNNVYLLSDVINSRDYGMFWVGIEQAIDEASTIDAERHGHWIGIDDEPCEVFECDKCGYITEDIGCADNKPNNFNYCPRCGALMEEIEE